MKLFSTDEERTVLLQRLHGAPNTPEIQSAIRIIEESIEYAEMRKLVANIFKDYPNIDKFENIAELPVEAYSMRFFCDYIDNLYKDIRLQRFKDFWNGDTSDIDDEGYKVI